MGKVDEYAKDVAVNAKASGMGCSDLGCFYEDDWDLTDAEWMQVVEKAIELYPTVIVPKETYRLWARVNADFRAAERFERMICAGA